MSRRAVIGAAAGLALLPGTAHASGNEVLSAVNTERTSAGIPAVERKDDWSEACARHNDYMATNRLLTHTEQVGSPLYSQSGAWAGRNAVLARSSGPFSGNPWTTAPLHQFQVLHPWLKRSGVDARSGYACMTTLSGRDGGYSAEPQLVTWPGFGQLHRASEVARESPFVPGDEVGLPQGTRTGPHIYLYPLGPSKFPRVVVRSATLTSNETAVDVPLRWVDATSSRSGRYLDGGAILIPVRPLTVGETYTLRSEVAATTGGGSTTIMSRTTSFQAAVKNGPAAPEAAPSTGAEAEGASLPTQVGRVDPTVLIGTEGQPQLRMSLAWSGKRTVRVRIRCVSPSGQRCEGKLRVMVYRKGGKLQKLRFKARKGPLRLNLAPDREIVRRVKLNKPQRSSARLRGLAARYGGAAPQRLADPRGRKGDEVSAVDTVVTEVGSVSPTGREPRPWWAGWLR